MSYLLNSHRFGAVASTSAYSTTVTDTTNLTTYTFSAVAIGTAASNREIVVAIVARRSGGGSNLLSSCTIGGVTADVVAASSGTADIWLVQATVPTGTTADIVIVWANSQTQCTIGVWYLYTDTPEPIEMTGAGTSTGATLTVPDVGVPADGFIIAAHRITTPSDGATGVAWTWSGAEAITERTDTNVELVDSISFADVVTTSARATDDLTCDPVASGTIGNVVVAVWQLSGAVVDPHFASVVLLAGFDGSDGATTFTDDSSSAHALTAVGNAQIDTAQSVFGGSSLLLDGTGDRVTAVDHADWRLSPTSEPFAIELAVRFASVTASQTLLAQWLTTGNQRCWQINKGASSPAVLSFFHSTNGTDFPQVDTSSLTWANDTWYRLVISYNGTALAIYRSVSGGVMTQVGLDTAETITMPDSTSLLTIGDRGNADFPVNGWIEEIRITKGHRRVGSGLSQWRVSQAAFPRS